MLSGLGVLWCFEQVALKQEILYSLEGHQCLREPGEMAAGAALAGGHG